MARRKFTRPKTSMMGIIGKVAPWVAFISQITIKDVAQIQSQVGIVPQLMGYINGITGRMTGITLFKSSPIQPRQTINIGGIANKWTGMGLAGMIYGELAKHFTMLPQGGKIRSIGKKVFIGGGLGGLFDDPTQQTTWINAAYGVSPIGNQASVNYNSNADTSSPLPFIGLRPF